MAPLAQFGRHQMPVPADIAGAVNQYEGRRARSEGRGSGCMIRLGDGTGIPGYTAGLATGGGDT